MPRQVDRTPFLLRHRHLHDGFDRVERHERAAGNQTLSRQDHAAGDGRRPGHEPGKVDLDPIVVHPNQLGGSGSGQRLQALGILARDGRLAVEDPDNPGGEALLEQRQQLVPDAVSRDRHVGVRRILAVLCPAGRQELPDLTARDIQQRTDDPPRLWMDPAQPARPCPADQPQQQRLRLVVGCVRDADAAGREAIRRPLEERVAGIVRRVLDRNTRPGRQAAHVHALDLNRQVKAGRDPAAEGFVLVGLSRAKLVVEMGNACELEAAGGGQLGQRQQQRHRVGAARDRGHHPRAGPDEIVPVDRAPDGAEHGRGLERNRITGKGHALALHGE